MHYLIELPEGVRELGRDEPVPDAPAIFRQVTSHECGQHFPAELLELLVAEYTIAREECGRDFSCGTAIPLNYNGQIVYQPTDFEKKVGERLEKVRAGWMVLI